jgi:SPP1 gp7 family putative phage head morphogenesis protein
MSYDEAFDYFRRMPSVNYKQYYANLKEYAGKAFTISWINSIETLDQINDLFEKEMTGTFDPQKFGDIIQKVIELRGEQPLENWHLDTVIRTNAQTAFSRGHLIAQKEADLPYWQYFAVMDGRESELCAGLDGKVFKSDDPFWDAYYPPNHYNCRSTVIALDNDDIKKDELDIEPDGKEYVESNPLIKVKEPIRGFKFSPLNSLDNYINEKCNELKIDKPKPQEPIK